MISTICVIFYQAMSTDTMCMNHSYYFNPHLQNCCHNSNEKNNRNNSEIMIVMIAMIITAVILTTERGNTIVIDQCP